jgi:hypothetical protein
MDNGLLPAGTGRFDDTGQEPEEFFTIRSKAGSFRFREQIRGGHQANPVIGFAGFFQGNGSLGDKIGVALGILGFGQVRPNRGCGPEKLFGDGRCIHTAGEMLVAANRPHGKGKALGAHDIVAGHAAFSILHSPFFKVTRTVR